MFLHYCSGLGFRHLFSWDFLVFYSFAVVHSYSNSYLSCDVSVFSLVMDRVIDVRAAWHALTSRSLILRSG